MLQSRKVRIILIDAVASTLILCAGQFLAPEWSDFAIKLVGVMQPAVVALVAGIAIEDAGAKAGGDFRFYDDK